MNGKGKLGKAGEDEVCRYLISRGHTILERNWRADKKHVIRVDDNAVLQPPDGHKLVLVGGQDDIAPVLLQDAAPVVVSTL